MNQVAQLLNISISNLGYNTQKNYKFHLTICTLPFSTLSVFVIKSLYTTR